MGIEAFEEQEETLRLCARLEAAEAARLAGAPTYTLEESRKRLEAILKPAKLVIPEAGQQELLYEAQALTAGMEDVKNGRVKDGTAVIDGLMDKYGI